MLLEKVHFSFIIVNQESDDVVKTDESLHLRLLVGSEHYQVQVLFIDHLHCVWNFGVDIKVNKLWLLIVIRVRLAQGSLNFKPILQSDVVKYFEDQFESAHLRSVRGVLVRHMWALILVDLVIVVHFISWDLKSYGIENVLIHESFTNQSAVFSEDTFELRVTVTVDLLIWLPTEPLSLEFINHVLKLLRHVQSALKQVSESQYLLIFSRFTKLGWCWSKYFIKIQKLTYSRWWRYWRSAVWSWPRLSER